MLSATVAVVNVVDVVAVATVNRIVGMMVKVRALATIEVNTGGSIAGRKSPRCTMMAVVLEPGDVKVIGVGLVDFSSGSRSFLESSSLARAASTQY